MKKILIKTADLIDMPKDAIAGLSRVEIVGNLELLIINHKGILIYESENIKLNANGQIIDIKGQELIIIAMSADEIRVKGIISSVNFLGV